MDAVCLNLIVCLQPSTKLSANANARQKHVQLTAISTAIIARVCVSNPMITTTLLETLFPENDLQILIEFIRFYYKLNMIPVIYKKNIMINDFDE